MTVFSLIDITQKLELPLSKEIQFDDGHLFIEQVALNTELAIGEYLVTFAVSNQEEKFRFLFVNSQRNKIVLQDLSRKKRDQLQEFLSKLAEVPRRYFRSHIFTIEEMNRFWNRAHQILTLELSYPAGKGLREAEIITITGYDVRTSKDYSNLISDAKISKLRGSFSKNDKLVLITIYSDGRVIVIPKMPLKEAYITFSDFLWKNQVNSHGGVSNITSF